MMQEACALLIPQISDYFNVEVNGPMFAENERTKELKAFDHRKLGVKGLVDAGITKIPRMFHHPSDNFNRASDLGHK
ncbi:putative 2-oxoacid dependent dioxygenase, partial [Mucuna pruriens]